MENRCFTLPATPRIKVCINSFSQLTTRRLVVEYDPIWNESINLIDQQTKLLEIKFNRVQSGMKVKKIGKLSTFLWQIIRVLIHKSILEF